MNALTPKQRKLAIIALVLAIPWGAHKFITTPMCENYDNYQRVIPVKQANLATMTTLKEAIGTEQQYIDAINQNVHNTIKDDTFKHSIATLFSSCDIKYDTDDLDIIATPVTKQYLQKSTLLKLTALSEAKLMTLLKTIDQNKVGLKVIHISIDNLQDGIHLQLTLGALMHAT